MAIQMRRGNEADLDISQLKAGEVAVCLDKSKMIVKLTGENYLTLTDMPELRKFFENEIMTLNKAVEEKAEKNHNHDVVSTTANGMAPKTDGSTSKFLRGDSTWAIPPNSKLYTSTGTATDGTMTQAAITNALNEVGNLHTHSMSQVTDLPIAMLKSTSTDEVIGATLCDIDGNPQFAAAKNQAGMYIYDDDGNRYQILLATIENNGVRISSTNGLNYITVTNDGINLYEDDVNVDTGWQEVALNTDNFKAYDGIASNSPVYRKIGDVVQIKGIVSPVNSDNSLGATTVTQIGSIPMEYAPSTLTVYAVCHGSNNAIWLLNVTPSGMIGAARYAIGETSSTPITSAWMPFSITYLI